MEDLPERVRTNGQAAALLTRSSARNMTLREMERDYILEILRRTEGNKKRAAEILDLDRKKRFIANWTNTALRASLLKSLAIFLRHAPGHLPAQLLVCFVSLSLRSPYGLAFAHVWSPLADGLVVAMAC
ncbi:MAG: helix-turn-helix domain-containing protein [Blastocatellia bacterium]